MACTCGSSVATVLFALLVTQSIVSVHLMSTQTPAAPAATTPAAPAATSPAAPAETSTPEQNTGTGPGATGTLPSVTGTVAGTDAPGTETTTEQHTKAPPTAVPTRPPSNALTTTDKIIIGVTSGVAGLVLIGAVVYGCSKRAQQKKERDEMFAKYNEAAQAKQGNTNRGFDNTL